jgi:hypothetical protein
MKEAESETKRCYAFKMDRTVSQGVRPASGSWKGTLLEPPKKRQLC